MSNIVFDKERHLYFVDGEHKPNISTILEDFHGYYKDDSSILNFGSVVHKTCELHDKGRLGDFDERVAGHLEAWKSFSSSFGNFDVIEEPLYSRTYQFCGTPDRALFSNGCLIEIKTGQHANWHALQTAAQQILIEENYKIKIKKRVVVQLKDGAFNVKEYKSPSDKIVFIGATHVWHWKRNHNLIKGV